MIPLDISLARFTAQGALSSLSLSALSWADSMLVNNADEKGELDECSHHGKEEEI